MSARRLAAAVLSAALKQAMGNQPGALASTDPEYVHRLRVGLRRYRSGLRVFRSLMRGKQRRRLQRRARAFMAPLGAVRDWDVCLAWLQSAGVPQMALRRAGSIRESLRKSLMPANLARLRPGAAAWKETREPLAEFRERALRAARRKVAKRIDRLDWSDAKGRHRLRIAVKRLRYTSEFLDVEAGSLRSVQDTLGKLNDLAVIRKLLPELHAPPGLERKLSGAERRLLALARRQVAALDLED